MDDFPFVHIKQSCFVKLLHVKNEEAATARRNHLIEYIRQFHGDLLGIHFQRPDGELPKRFVVRALGHDRHIKQIVLSYCWWIDFRFSFILSGAVHVVRLWRLESHFCDRTLHCRNGKQTDRQIDPDTDHRDGQS